MAEENISQEIRLKNIYEKKIIEEINRNELINKKHKKVCTALNYKLFLILGSAIIECVSISAFASLFGIQ